jgi:hypothetical protein
VLTFGWIFDILVWLNDNILLVFSHCWLTTSMLSSWLDDKVINRMITLIFSPKRAYSCCTRHGSVTHRADKKSQRSTSASKTKMKPGHENLKGQLSSF